MARSLKKGPFVDEHLMKKVEALNAAGKKEVIKLVTEATVETYEELTPQLIQLIDQTKHNENLTEAQKQDEISLHMLGYVKSCTNEIIIDVLAEILGLD